MKVYSMASACGNIVPNQCSLKDDKGNRFFQSYNSIILKRDANGSVVLDPQYYNYSKTTVKYRNIFLNETTKQIEEKIKKGIYTFENLNQDLSGQDRESYSDNQDRKSYV